ncbi:MAG: hypothetical protein RBS88_07495 [Spongiibacteraceae bacterium]|jgi:hypothetical protein|nr:hypothetical protein [Spongiibacteraceae bacterium]
MFRASRLIAPKLLIMLAWLVAGCTAGTPDYRAHNHPVDFSGFWELGQESMDVIRPEYNEANLTDAARARLAEFRKRFPEGETKWPMDLCHAHGMPWTSLWRARTYSSEIIQQQNRIFVKHELFDTFRDIRLDVQEVPPNFGPSNEGYSVARWDGDVLVIETSGLIALNDYSDLQRSADAHIVEHWRLERDASGEEFLITELWVNDPAVYREPAYGRKKWRRMPEGTTVNGYNCNNALWDDYVATELSRQQAEGSR